MKRIRTVALVTVFLLTGTAASAEDETPDPWEPIHFLLGSWSGGGSGMGGNSDLTHTYELGFGARITWEHVEAGVYHMTLELRPPEKEWFGCRSMELKRAE